MKLTQRAFLIPAIAASMLSFTPASAQDSGVGKRVDRLEKEMRAVQRKVFDGASSEFFEADIKPESTNPAAASSTTSAVSDLITRVDALERSFARLTGQVEQNNFRLKQIEDKMAQNAAANTPPAASNPDENDSGTNGAAAGGSAPANDPAPDPSRVEGVASIVMPDTGDAGEDAYIYGYRLWEAKYFPEAQVQLKKAFESHPKHRRASFAQNLLGRAYLDDGKPALASVALYENYQKLPRGERAPDSLYFLSTALVELNKKDDACRVLAELQDVYPDEAAGRLANRIASGKKAGNCK